MIHEVKELTFSLGDTELLNDCLYQNYNSAVAYFDDDLEKTAYFLDTLSRSDIYESYVKRTQNYELKSVQYLPAYSFKKYCAGKSTAFIDFPKLFRELR
jgi:hypothetical protein